MSALRVSWLATQGADSGDAKRIATLLDGIDAEPVPFDRSRRAGSVRDVLAGLRRRRPDLLVLEGTGAAGGAAAMAAHARLGIPYVVSSGDAVAPYLASRSPMLGPPATVYERLLLRRCAGFIGWSPYLTGRALTLGAPRAMTAAHWGAPAAPAGTRERVRARLGIPAGHVVFGIVGKLRWNARHGYGYGLELVRALAAADREDVAVVVVGAGDALPRLVAASGGHPGLHLVGSVGPEEVPDLLAAFDVASLPQSVDGVGAFRYTTKLPEYLSAGLPVVTGQIPLGYDLDDGFMWRLPGDAPWDPRYVAGLADLMRGIDHAEVARRAARVPRDAPQFDRARQAASVTAFLHDVVDR